MPDKIDLFALTIVDYYRIQAIHPTMNCGPGNCRVANTLTGLRLAILPRPEMVPVTSVSSVRLADVERARHQ